MEGRARMERSRGGGEWSRRRRGGVQLLKNNAWRDGIWEKRGLEQILEEKWRREV